MKLCPGDGGCWYCREDDEYEPLVFECEFDTYVHLSCLRWEVDHTDNPEAKIQSYLLEQ